MAISYKRLNHENFSVNSLDDFVRYQKVTECWRNIDGEWRLVPISFEENWSLERLREEAADIAFHMEKDQTAFGAFDGEGLVGFITVSHELFGTTAKYAELVGFQVSYPYRGNGIGKNSLKWLAVKLKKLARKNCIFRDTPPRKAKRHIRLSAVFTLRKSIKSWRRKNRAMCSLNTL